MLQKLLTSFCIFSILQISKAQTTYEFDGTTKEEAGQMNFIIGYNSFYNNYPKVHFYFEDSTQNILLNDSIVFRGINSTFRLGINPQWKIKNDFFMNFGVSASIPFGKHFQLNSYSIGMGYQFKLNNFFYLRPQIEYEINRNYYSFKPFDGIIGQSLYINGRNMGNDVNIRYIQTSHGITPKINFGYRPKKLNNNNQWEIGLDCGYHLSFKETGRVQFRYDNNSSGNLFTDLIIIAFRNFSSKKIPTQQVLYYKGNPVSDKIINAEKIFFSFKIGYTF